MQNAFLYGWPFTFLLSKWDWEEQKDKDNRFLILSPPCSSLKIAVEEKWEKTKHASPPPRTDSPECWCHRKQMSGKNKEPPSSFSLLPSLLGSETPLVVNNLMIHQGISPEQWKQAFTLPTWKVSPHFSAFSSALNPFPQPQPSASSPGGFLCLNRARINMVPLDVLENAIKKDSTDVATMSAHRTHSAWGCRDTGVKGLNSFSICLQMDAPGFPLICEACIHRTAITNIQEAAFNVRFNKRN